MYSFRLHRYDVEGMTVRLRSIRFGIPDSRVSVGGGELDYSS